MSSDVEYSGSCHCGSIKWKVTAPKVLHCFRCNCSVCKKKCNDHFIVKKPRFTLIQGEDNLSTYRFNSMLAQHKFCKTCGVQSFYVPRSNPDDIGVMPHCIDSPQPEKIEWTYFDGQNWEQEMNTKAPVAI